MIFKSTFALFFAVVVAGVLLAGSGSAAPMSSHASLVIRHQLHGCHAWSLNGGAFAAKQTVSLPRGGSVTVVDNDVMSHKLIKTSGAAVTITNMTTGMMGTKAGQGMMAHMGASTKVVFSRRGVYTFTTKPGEDYMSGVKTIGEDNVLRLTVTVS